MKKQLVAREQEITAVQARMQASYREHVKEVQQLQGKVGSAEGRGLERSPWADAGARGGVLQNPVCFGEEGLSCLARWCQPAGRVCLTLITKKT